MKPASPARSSKGCATPTVAREERIRSVVPFELTPFDVAARDGARRAGALDLGQRVTHETGELVREVRVDRVRQRRLAVEHSAPGSLQRSRARRPKSTEMTGSKLPWPIATGGSGRERSSSRPSTVGMKPLSATGRRARPALGQPERVGHRGPLREAAEDGPLRRDSRLAAARRASR